MTRNDPVPSFSDDDHLRGLINEVVASSPDLQEGVAALQEDDEMNEQLASAEAAVIDFLRDRATPVDTIDRILSTLSKDKDTPTMTDVLITLRELSDELTAINAPREMYLLVDRMLELAYAISGIAIASDPEMAYTKKSIQTSILDSSFLSAAEKEALLEASDQFIEGESLDTTDPDDVSKALVTAEQEAQKKADNRSRGRQAGGLFNDLIASKYGLDIESNECTVLRGLVRLAAAMGTSTVMGDVSESLSKLNIPADDFYQVVEHIIDTTQHKK